MVFGDKKIPWDDRVVTRELLQDLLNKKGVKNER